MVSSTVGQRHQRSCPSRRSIHGAWKASQSSRIRPRVRASVGSRQESVQFFVQRSITIICAIGSSTHGHYPLTDLRRGWGIYKSFYLFVKLSTLLVVAVLYSDNCLFRNANRNTLPIIRQSILVFAMCCFLLVQSFLSPFLDPVNNASEWISRVGYVAFAVIGLTAALDLPSGVKNALDGPLLYMCVSRSRHFNTVDLN